MSALYTALAAIGAVMLISSLAADSITDVIVRSILGIAVLLLGIGLAIERKREERECEQFPASTKIKVKR